ncbi:unnamed protein product [Notodromas monacha]|uniref:Galactosylgalactosylxylosylprotein 3-beta-glucuronosyltransferase n=1 Tax=Notodromas monacha TaxID=399045 RepID=A0A7R9BTG4_9CRUS|nr:unnamed protein product [Notodromas monacha]CAG0920400.1 unnamed protein product [Notodromas monacha]
MPAENLEEEGLQKNPNLDLAQLKFLLSLPSHKDDEGLRTRLMDAIKSNDMAPFYKEVCTDLGWPLDEALLTQMKAKNAAKLKELDEAAEDAEKNAGETEVRDAYQLKAEYLCRIGAKEESLSAFRKALDKTVALGHRLDLIFHLIRIGLFYMDHKLIVKSIEKAKSLIEEGGDWDRRNRLKVYEGLYSLSVRKFKQAATLFLDTVSTFTSYELMDYSTFVVYTVYVTMLTLPRNEMREKVVRGAEILEVLHNQRDVKEFLMYLYDCNYGKFFLRLADVETIMKTDRFWAPHYRFYVREMRILAYAQLLESYRSLTLAYMAESFGVTVDFIDRELSRFIAAGRLHCKIDRVGGIVETNRPDSKNWQYQSTIKQGDLLLNRIQKLSRLGAEFPSKSCVDCSLSDQIFPGFDDLFEDMKSVKGKAKSSKPTSKKPSNKKIRVKKNALNSAVRKVSSGPKPSAVSNPACRGWFLRPVKSFNRFKPIPVEERSERLLSVSWQKLKSARFRQLNESLYSVSGEEAQELFLSDPNAFEAYHEGYRQQVAAWPINPLDIIIEQIKELPRHSKVADLGCGEGKLALAVPQEVHSYDLVACAGHVTACDIKKTPLKAKAVDVAVFCLSLMGTNLNDFVIEANRILKVKGLLKIADVDSRFIGENEKTSEKGISRFCKALRQFGFKLRSKNLEHNVFVFLEFRKSFNVLVGDTLKTKKPFPELSLKPPGYVSVYRAVDGLSPALKRELERMCSSGNNEKYSLCRSAIRPSLDELPMIFAITPTYSRYVQKAELTSRLCHTFLHVPRFHWIVVEDAEEKTSLVTRFLQKCGVAYTHLNVPTDPRFKTPEAVRARLKPPRGVRQRNAGLHYLSEKFTVEKSPDGVVYFADDDNTYDLRLFDEMRSIKGVGVWPVALVGGLLVEKPLVGLDGRIKGWNSVWKPERPFPVDMAGFAVNLQLLLKHPELRFRDDVEVGYLESYILETLEIPYWDIEVKANNATEVYVWHTRAEEPKLKMEQKLMKPSNSGMEI